MQLRQPRSVLTLALLALLACAACKQRQTERVEASAAVSAPPASTLARAASSVPEGPPLPVVSSELEVNGLRVRSGTIAGATLWGFSDLALDLRLLRLEIVVAAGGGALKRLLPEGGLAVVNGGYFEVDFRPSTWVVRRGVELSPKASTAKGGVLALGSGGPFVGPFQSLGFAPELAVQSYPLIVEADGSPGIHRDDGRRAARTVACLVGNALHFVLISAPRGEGPTLFESVPLLREPPPRGFGCRAALNLDGGPSTGVWFGSSVPAKQRLPFAPVGYAIAILPKPFAGP
jgi:hypothetical protein